MLFTKHEFTMLDIGQVLSVFVEDEGKVDKNTKKTLPISSPFVQKP